MSGKKMLATVLASVGVSALAGPDPVFDMAAITALPLEGRVTASSEAEGIVTEEVRFLSEIDGTNRVEIFAYFCYPKGAAKIPGVVWNQSGMARAATYFPLLLARRGYAALCIDMPQAGYRSTGGYSINSGMTGADDPRQSGIAHGVVALVRAVSYLQSRAEVDPARIGMCGSSWGGFFTTLAMGVDPRIQAASSMFGCGSLQDGCVWLHGKEQAPDPAYLEKWARTLDPAFRLAGLTRPIAWLAGSNDHFFWFNALMATHARPAGPKHLALIPNFDHGLTPIVDEQVFGWLDVHLKGAPPFIAVDAPRVELKGEQRVFRWNWTSPVRKPASAELSISYGRPGNWKTRYWQTVPATVGGDGVCEAALPDRAFPLIAFGTVVETNGYRSSTAALEVPAAPKGKPLDATAYNGCGMWGAFEEPDVAFLTLMGLLKPVVTNDAHGGRQAIVVKGKARIPTSVYYAAGVPHRFSLFAKSAEPSTLKVTLDGTFDGKPREWTATAETGPAWKEIVIPLTPPDCRSPNLSVLFESGTSAVIIDDVVLAPAP